LLKEEESGDTYFGEWKDILSGRKTQPEKKKLAAQMRPACRELDSPAEDSNLLNYLGRNM
jgi:hypothetical protein